MAVISTGRRFPMWPVILKGWPVLFAEGAVSGGGGGMEDNQRIERSNISAKETGRGNHELHECRWLSEETHRFSTFKCFFKFRWSGPLSTSKLRTALPVAGPSSLQGCLRIQSVWEKLGDGEKGSFPMGILRAVAMGTYTVNA